MSLLAHQQPMLATPAAAVANGELDALVQAFVSERLARLTQYLGPPAPKPGKKPSLEAVVQQVQAKLLSHQFCKQRPDDQAAMSATLTGAIAQNAPIPCIVGHGPLKNPNNNTQPYADWAEFFTYLQLLKLNHAVRQIYAPGLSVTFYLDDARSTFANRIDAPVMTSYRQSVVDLIEAMGATAVIHSVSSLAPLYERLDHGKHLPAAGQWVDGWWARPENEAEKALLLQHAHNNLPGHPSPHDPRCQEAARRYLTAYQAELRCGIWSRPDTLYMRYNAHPGFYQIFTLRKGSITQPWQGQGAVLLTRKQTLDPYLLTRNKQSHLTRLGQVDVSSSHPLFARYPYLGRLNVVQERPQGGQRDVLSS